MTENAENSLSVYQMTIWVQFNICVHFYMHRIHDHKDDSIFEKSLNVFVSSTQNYQLILTQLF